MGPARTDCEVVPEHHDGEGDTPSRTLPRVAIPNGKPFHPPGPGYGADGRSPGSTCSDQGRSEVRRSFWGYFRVLRNVLQTIPGRRDLISPKFFCSKNQSQYVGNHHSRSLCNTLCNSNFNGGCNYHPEATGRDRGGEPAVLGARFATPAPGYPSCGQPSSLRRPIVLQDEIMEHRQSEERYERRRR